jgi:hypothetical protein
MDEKKTINVVCEEESTLDRIKRMTKKAKNKVLDGIEYAIDHPVETTAKIGAVTVLANQVGKLAGAVTRPAREAKENRRYYDRFNSCRRRLTSREEQELDMYVRSGGYAYDWLKQRRLLK